MKLLHLGDLHLGKTLGEFDLFRDQEYILNEIIKITIFLVIILNTHQFTGIKQLVIIQSLNNLLNFRL